MKISAVNIAVEILHNGCSQWHGEKHEAAVLMTISWGVGSQLPHWTDEKPKAQRGQKIIKSGLLSIGHLRNGCHYFIWQLESFFQNDFFFLSLCEQYTLSLNLKNNKTLFLHPQIMTRLTWQGYWRGTVNIRKMKPELWDMS